MATPPLIFVLNGPNLNLLGTREPQIYGHETLSNIVMAMHERAAGLRLNLEARQSNHEGELIDWLHEAHERKAGAVILNGGGLTHTSVALRDAVASIEPPVIEVHLSNPYAREAFRRQSLIAPVSRGGIHGFGAQGYLLALDAAARLCVGTDAADSPEKQKQGIENGPSQRRH
jgi:3-dehydroquinate dehydratase-2